MRSVDKLRARARLLRREITAIHYACRSPKLPLLPKLLLLLTLAYALSPIDLVPDFIPVLGYLDDLIILPALIALSIKLIPADLMKECRARAEKEPLELKKKPGFAVVIILIWAAVTAAVIAAVWL
ncbi:MAG TPA: DUF1232 domain-containing protein [Spirochaetota bacterium]|nr:DUF1232 domain-containing protein [Spirochaetota bacterium]HPI89712.1 DUF1232 domain-containing protein [Spirochaetota bacterium]HPR48329.1 DUF1232 domain-containing protein [Spirochaetota bacterium]